MALERKEYWDTRALHDFLLEREPVPFKWGVNDCCLFPADAILAMTGTDIAKDFRGQYKTQLQAFKRIKWLTSGETVADAVAYCANQFNLEEHTFPLMAKRGDLVVLDNGGELIAGIVHLNGRHVISVSANGLVRLPITTVTRSWSV